MSALKCDYTFVFENKEYSGEAYLGPVKEGKTPFQDTMSACIFHAMPELIETGALLALDESEVGSRYFWEARGFDFKKLDLKIVLADLSSKARCRDLRFG